METLIFIMPSSLFFRWNSLLLLPSITFCVCSRSRWDRMLKYGMTGYPVIRLSRYSAVSAIWLSVKKTIMTGSRVIELCQGVYSLGVIWISGCVDIRLSGYIIYLDFPIIFPLCLCSRSRGRILGPSLWMVPLSGYPAIRFSGYWFSGYPVFRLPRFLAIRASSYPVIQLLGFPDIWLSHDTYIRW